MGWAHAYIGENRYDPEEMTAKLGKTWHSKDTIVIKKYPCCGSNHGALDSLIALLKEHDVKLDDIVRVEVDNVPAISHVLLASFRSTTTSRPRWSIARSTSTASPTPSSIARNTARRARRRE